MSYYIVASQQVVTAYVMVLIALNTRIIGNKPYGTSHL